MPISIRDPRAAELARQLAARRGTNMTEAIVSALQAALEQERRRIPLSERIDEIVGDLASEARPGGHRMSQAEIDAMWGSDAED